MWARTVWRLPPRTVGHNSMLRNFVALSYMLIGLLQTCAHCATIQFPDICSCVGPTCGLWGVCAVLASAPPADMYLLVCPGNGGSLDAMSDCSVSEEVVRRSSASASSHHILWLKPWRLSLHVTASCICQEEKTRMVPRGPGTTTPREGLRMEIIQILLTDQTTKGKTHEAR